MNGIPLQPTVPQGIALGKAPTATVTPPPSSGSPSAPATPYVPPAFADSFKTLGQVAQAGNTPQEPQDQGGGGLFNDVKDFGIGLVKGVGQTAFTIASLGGRLADAVTGEKHDYSLPDSLKATNAAQKLGSGAEQILELLAMPETGLAGAATEFGAKGAEIAAKVGLGAEKAATVAKGAELGIKALGSGAENAALGQLHGSSTPGTDFAFGAAAPVVGAGISKLWDNASSIIGKTFNLPKAVQTLFETPEGKTLFKQGVQEVAQNPQAPYANLAQEVFDGMTKAEKDIKGAYKAGIAGVKAATERAAPAGIDAVGSTAQKQVFSVVPDISEINKVLKGDYGLAVEKAGDVIRLTPESIANSPFSDAETNAVNKLLGDISNGSGKTFQGLMNLQDRIESYFDQNAFGQAKSTPFNSLVGKLSDVVDSKVSAVTEKFQPVMKDLNAQYREYKQVFRAFGKKFIDTTQGQPQLAVGAESFLSNLLNKNKSVLQDNVAKKLEEFTGVPILDRVTAIKAATDMSQLASSGKVNMVQKILRNVGAGVGYIKGGFEGALAGRKAGEVIGSVASPNTGLKTLGAIDKAKTVISKLPKGNGKAVEAAAKVAARGG